MISLVFDTETTGLPLPMIAPLEKQPKIIELALTLVDNGKVIGSRSWLFNPGEPLSATITKITGLTDDDLAGKPTFAECLQEVMVPFKRSDITVAHNHNFDYSLMQFELMRCGCTDFPWPDLSMCTVQEYRHVMGFQPSLMVLYEHVMGKPLAQTHRAQDDVDALVELLIKEGAI